LAHPNGSEYFRFKYRFSGKEKLLALGVYPDLSLKDARERRDEARKFLTNGIDPSAVRKARKLARQERAAHCFEAVAAKWFEK
jgi:hypothetical protein